MINTAKHTISNTVDVREALEKLNLLTESTGLTLFVCDETEKLVGTLTDGDIRRGFVNGLQLTDHVSKFMNTKFRYLQKNNYSISDLDDFRKLGVRLVPVIDGDFRIVRIINFAEKKSVLPVDAIIMAGGRGDRLKPLTDLVPKPLLKIGTKPIIEYNIDRLSDYGVQTMYLTIRYLGEQLVDYFNDGAERGLNIQYIREEDPLGTIGAIGMIDEFQHDNLLVMNSDLLTNINFEDFYREFSDKDADFAVASVPYQVNVPYAVLETDEGKVISFKEKPTYTYYSNAGIYLMKKEVVDHIPKGSFYNATDLMEHLIALGKKVVFYPLLGYWLDIGRPEDYKKAQEDIKHIRF